MPDKTPAHHGRGGTVGGGGNCATDTEVSKQSNVGRGETMVGSSKVVVGHKSTGLAYRHLRLGGIDIEQRIMREC